MLPTIRTILYATDLGHHAPAVFRYALSLAQRYEAKIHVVYAVEPLSGTARQIVDLYAHAQLPTEPERERLDKLVSTLKGRLTEFCAAECCLAALGENVVAGLDVAEGKPADVVLSEAKRVGADVIVLGSHSHSTLGEVLLGSVAHRVVQRAAVPVLLVRTTEGGTSDGV